MDVDCDVVLSCTPLGVKAVFKRARTLRQTLMQVKTRIPEERKRGMVYEVPCKECHQTYIGKTKRTLKVRLGEHKQAVESQRSGEATGKELVKILKAHRVEASVSSVLRWRKDLSWTLKGTSYCQMIRDVNKEKRLKFAQENKEMTFDDIIYTDETTGLVHF